MFNSCTIILPTMNTQSPITLPFQVSAEDPIEDGPPTLEVHEEEVVQDEVEEVAVPDPVVDNGDYIFEDAPETKQQKEEQIVITCSRFGCRVPDNFAEVVQCLNTLYDRMMHIK